MKPSVLTEVKRLRGMSVAELRVRWRELYGEDSRSRNKDYLFRRLSWRLQELAHGGLSDLARDRADELAPDRFQRARTPASVVAIDDETRGVRPRPIRDPKRPTPGTVLSRRYHGHQIRVVTLDHGFEYDGQAYRSLSAVALAVTGQKWNGRLFFGLTERKRKR